MLTVIYPTGLKVVFDKANTVSYDEVRGLFKLFVDAAKTEWVATIPMASGCTVHCQKEEKIISPIMTINNI